MSELINQKNSTRPIIWIKSIIFTIIGFILFFVPIKISGYTSIPIDHMVTNIKKYFPEFTFYFTIIIIYAGAVLPFIDKSWKKNTINIVFTGLKLIACVFTTMFLINRGPAILMADNMIPFLFTKILYPVVLVVPIGAALLTLIIDYVLIPALNPEHFPQTFRLETA
ncbi:MAG: hypothetical protein JEZ04_20510 [Spirochaetales bacterium]|nr:hypothetical protein [Spirochaetales bacterium]